MKITLGKKVEMTSFLDENGNMVAATIVDASPVTVTAVRTNEKDGYQAVQLGYGSRKEKRINKPQKSDWDGKFFEAVKEFRFDGDTMPSKGDTLAIADMFEAGDVVSVTGTSKGKGFQGVVKRHNFAGGRRSHGQKHSEWEPGSIGATGPQRVFKGTRMAGRMGTDRTNVKNLKVLHVDAKGGKLIIKGAVPGRRGTLLEIVGK